MSSRLSATLGLVLAFGSGFGVLALEVAGARVLAGSYGLSSIPWTAVITMVLAGLAVGNVVGGVAIDRGVGSLWLLFLGAGGWSIVAILGSSIPATLLATTGFLGGALVSAAIYFLVPSMLMGAVTPILVERMTGRVEEVGLRFGDVGAWSTTGAIAGTVATGFLLLPHLALTVVLALVAGYFLLCASLAALMEGGGVRFWIALATSPMPILIGFNASIGEASVFAGQSAYASLRVADTDWYGDVPVREFWQNGSLSSAEHRETGEPTQFYKITLAWLLTDRIERIDSVLVLGGAANTLPTQLRRMNRDLHVTVVEIDSEAVRVAREFFSFGELKAGEIEMRIADARPFLRAEERKYDVVIADVYDNLYSVPWHLVTAEAFEEMAARLKVGGLLTLTLSTPIEGPGAAFLRRVDTTLETVFPHVRTYVTRSDIPLDATQEVVIVAARQARDLPEVDWPWLDVVGAGPPLRDDYAPVEFLQAIRFLNDPAWR